MTAMKEVRSKILKSVASFRGEEDTEDKGKVALADDLRCVALKSGGDRCLNRRGVDSDCCKVHKK